MLLTVDKLSIEFNEDEEAMEHEIQELKKLEKAIEDSTHYKLLAGKTQMISRGKGKVKKERSRLQHTKRIVERVVVPQIEEIYDKILEKKPIFQSSEEYKRKFEMNKEIALLRGRCMAKAHDIGHVPFGHEGEKAINEFFSEITDETDIEAMLDEHLRYFGKQYEKNQGHIEDDTFDDLFPPYIEKQLSFEHNELGAILLNRIMNEQGIDLTPEQKLSLTMGVLGHSTSRTPFELLQGDIIAQIVRVADKVEYINYDYDEIAGLVKIDTLKMPKPLLDYMAQTSVQRIEQTNHQLVAEAFELGVISEKKPAMKDLKTIRKTYDDLIYFYDGTYADNLLKNLLAVVDDPTALEAFYRDNPGVEILYPKETLEMLRNTRTLIAESRKKGSNIKPITLERAYDRVTTEQLHFKGVLQGENSDRISLIYRKILEYYYEHQEAIPDSVTRPITPIDFINSEVIDYQLDQKYTPLQRTLEYISLMDDQEMLTQYRELVEKRIEQGKGFGIEPITITEVKQYLRATYEAEIEKVRRTTSDDDAMLSFTEARKRYASKTNHFFSSVATAKGKEAMAQSYQERLGEYAEDYELCQRMIERDKERAGIKTVQLPGAVVEVRSSARPMGMQTEYRREAQRPVIKKPSTVGDTLKNGIARFFRKPAPEPKDVRYGDVKPKKPTNPSGQGSDGGADHSER